MKTFKLNIYSWTNYNFCVAVGLIIGAVAMFVTASLNQTPTVGLISLVLGIIPFILFGLRAEKGTAELSVDKEGLSIKWINNFIIFKHPDYNFKFSDLKEYVFEYYTHGYYRLSVTTVKGKTVRFKFKHSSKDEFNFEEFIETLKQSIFAYNNKDNDSTNDIRVGKSMWGGTTAKVVALLCSIVIIDGWIRIAKGTPRVESAQLTLCTILVAVFIGIVVNASTKKINSDKL
jgi:hypothetical protein